jgi:hypothetical protein
VAFTLLALGAAPPAAVAQWRVQQEKDPITDELVTAFIATSTNTVPNAVGLPVHAQLVLRCAGGRFTAVYLVTSGYAGDEARVQYRLDGGTPHEEVWEGGRARNALFVRTNFTGISDSMMIWMTAAGLRNSSKAVFRWFPPLQDARTATFVVSGFRARPQAALAACGEDQGSIERQKESRYRSDSVAAAAALLRHALESSDSTLPWAGSSTGMTYFRNETQCADARFYKKASLVFFRSDSAAKRLGRSRSTEEGC